MRTLIPFLFVYALIAGCHNGTGRNNSDSILQYPPAVRGDSNNMSLTDTSPPVFKGKPNHIDTSTSGNGQNTGIIRDTSGSHKNNQ